MPKLIIPNAYELYQATDALLTQDDINARFFHNLRFLWLLEPGDIILLPKMPPKGFLSYLAKVKNINPDTLYLIILDDKHKSLNSAALSGAGLVAELRHIMSSPAEWHIHACYFNREVFALAKKLHLSLTPEWENLIASDFILHANSKAEFRKMAHAHAIPIPEGAICLTKNDLVQSITALLPITGQLIIKQEYNASGKGNIGFTDQKNKKFVGVIDTIFINPDQCLADVAQTLCETYVDMHNPLLVVEVYYPNQGTFTAQFSVPARGQKPVLLNCSEILMESRWVGVQIPPGVLSPIEKKELISHSEKFSSLLQAKGYQGYLCCDAILSEDQRILFTEINVRPGAETHAYLLAQSLFGLGYENNMIVLTRNDFYADSFTVLYKKLKTENLLVSAEKKWGVVLLTVDDTESKKCEYLLAGPDCFSVQTLEERMMKVLKAPANIVY